MKSLLIVFSIAFAVISVQAEIKPNNLFSDHVVLQCDAPVPIWGTAAPDEKILVEFAGQSKTATADASGKWRVNLDPLPASAEPRVLSIGSRKINDVLVGEVWLASGQSNMASPLASAHNAAEALPQAQDDQLRFFNLTKKTAAEPQSEVSGGKWELSTPDTAKNFSAVAYFFAREIRKARNCPVAVISGAWGGTPIHIWISLDALKKEPAITRSVTDWDKALEDFKKVQANPDLVTQYEKDLKQWTVEVKPAFDAAMKEFNVAKAAGGNPPKPTPARPEPSNPDPMAIPSPSRRPHTPSVAYNAMIAPLTPFALRGFLWYQGEENGSTGMDYRSWLPRLIEDWRTRFEGERPFLIVQLPANGPDSKPVAEGGWPLVREAQMMALKLPQTGMAITIDVGDPKNVHPADKIDVGQRLALVGRKVAYGETLVSSGPLYQSFTVEADKIRLAFRETGSGLTPGVAPWRAPGVEPFPSDKLIGFYIAGEDKIWAEADAKIDGETVVVSSSGVPKPVAVRYGWASSPRCNLYNKEGLPASPFRTDDWSK